MRVLVVANHYAVASGRYAADALKRLGHEVRTDGPAKGRDIWGMQVDERHIWTPQPPEEGWKADLCIVMDSDPAILDDLKRYPTVKKIQAPVVVWGVDNHVRNYERPWFDHYFLAHRHITQQPFTDTTTWLPCTTDLTRFPPSVIPWKDRQFDVAMIGVMYERRARLVEKLRQAGLKVLAQTGMVYEQYRAAYQNSRISLCVSANGDLAQRVFETGGMACTVLTDPVADLVHQDTNEALKLAGFGVYWSDEECVAKALEYIHVEAATATAGALMMAARCMKHTWDERAKVVLAWAEGKVSSEFQVPSAELTDGKPEAAPVVEIVDDAKPEAEEQKPYLNLGCGKTHFPSATPPGHEMVAAEVYAYPKWVNVDKVEGVGADKVFDLFTYPWPLADNSFDGAVLGHIVEHIPHEIKVYEERILPPGVVQRSGQFYNEATGERVKVEFDTTRQEQLRKMQDGWYAFFSELWRVLSPGAKAHIISPYGWSDGGITDPSHTRYLTTNTFTHALAPENNGGETFRYEIGCNFRMAAPVVYRTTELFRHLLPLPDDDEETQAQKNREFHRELMTRVNVVYDFYITLVAVK